MLFQIQYYLNCKFGIGTCSIEWVFGIQCYIEWTRMEGGPTFGGGGLDRGPSLPAPTLGAHEKIGFGAFSMFT